SGANDGGTGSDTLSIDASGLVASGLGSFQFVGGTGQDTLNVNGGSYSFAADASIDSAHLTVNVANNASVVFASTQQLVALNLADTSQAQMGADGNRVLVVTALSIGPNAKLDLNDNDLIVDYSGASPFNDLY